MDMTQSAVPRISSVVVAALTFGCAAQALAVPINLSVAATPKDLDQAYQQTKDDPCIFGNSDCKSPANWDFADTPTGNQSYNSNLWSYSLDKASPDKSTNNVFTDHAWDLVSKNAPTLTFYTSTQLYSVLGCAPGDTSCGFFIGFDNNRTADPQVLKGFDIWECANKNDVTGVQITGNGNCTQVAQLGASFLDFSMTSNFGTGWSDYKFYDPNGNLGFRKQGDGSDYYYAFNLKYMANDGPDSAFLIRSGTPPTPCGIECEVPLPGSLSLIGAGLLGLAGLSRGLPIVRRRLGRRI
ncbi:MAG: hypothetical protein U1E86_24495 [Burkholderiaceae bacterium]